jgi:demethylmenaquinone methyltransferase/2-methoxy-6-polyprenyl-1,4-benzoquinol methylase
MNSPDDARAEVAWSDEELLSDPHAAADKPERVRRMFAAIARRYDLNNRLHSFGRDQVWRRRAVEAAAVQPGDCVLDIACGTGDLTLAFERTRAAQVVGLDFTPEMIELARAKTARRGIAEGRVSFVEGDAMNLPIEDGTFNVVSVAFGLRNVAEPNLALAEFHRVLRRGGRVVILEFSRPRSHLIRWFNDVYTRRVMPLTASLIARDRSGAYRYLPRSVETFPEGAAVCAMLEAAGFTNVTARPLTLGVCTIYRAVRP